MIVVKLQGGLGNQMFQYAFGRSLADRLGQQLAFDLTTLTDTRVKTNFTYRKFELDRFPVRGNIADQKTLASVIAHPKSRVDLFKLRLLKLIGILQHLVERKFSYDEDLLNVLDSNIFIAGFWQSEKYFSKIAGQIRADLKLPALDDQKNLKCIRLIQSCNAVSLHVRRGDYVENQTHPLCSIQYYKDALDIIHRKISDPVFFIFSDDTNWTHQNLSISGKSYVINHNQGNGPADMYLMSLCKHHIIANSTFSWWGAWLNAYPDKTVIAPKKWFNDPFTDTRDLIPEHWIMI